MNQLDIFYNSIPLKGQDLTESRIKAGTQNERILRILKQAGTHLTPVEVWSYYCKHYPEIPLTSVRRSLTTLTNLGLAEQVEVKKMGIYGKLNNQWKAK